MFGNVATLSRLWSLVALSLVLWPSPSLSRPVVTVDARTRQIVGASPKELRAGEKFTLEVIHPNLFRESYDLKVGGVDVHRVDLPSSIKDLVSVSSPRREELPQLAWVVRTKTRDVQLFHETMARGDSLMFPSELEEPFTSVTHAWSSIREELEHTAGAVLYERPVAPLRSSLMAAVDNAQVRKVANDRLRSVLSRWHVAPGAADPGAVLDSIEYRADRWFGTWHTVHQRWLASKERWYRRWRISGGDYSPEAAGALFADSQVTSVHSRMMQLRTDIDFARKEMENFATIIRAAADPIRFPNSIARTVRVDGDQLVATVKISPSQLNSEEEKGMPQRPEVTISHSIPVHGRWTLDVSTGFLLTPLRHTNYITVPSPDSTSSDRIVQEGVKDEEDLSPAVFVHYVRTLHWDVPWALGGTLGFAPSSPKRYLVGGCLGIGRGLRFMVSIGLAWGEVTKLNGEKVGEKLVNSPLDVEEVIRTDLGGAFSLAITIPPSL